MKRKMGTVTDEVCVQSRPAQVHTEPAGQRCHHSSQPTINTNISVCDHTGYIIKRDVSA